MKHRICFLILTLFVTGFTYAQDSYRYYQPKTLDDGWKTSNLKAQQIDTTLIYKLFTQIKNGKNKIHSVLIVKDEQLLIEEYFNGYSIEKPHDLRSTSKSVKAILMGIAIDKGFVGSVNELLTKYIKNPVATRNIDERKSKINIKHLLTMSSGLDCNDWDKKSKGQEDKVYKKKDWLQYTLNLPMVNEPGTVSNYCSMGVILVAEIISQASGMTIDKFAEKHLFSLLDITNLHWGDASDKNAIPSGKSLYMTPRDMAKIGQLVLNKGLWKDQQIVSQEWIEECTTPKTKITGIDYGYLWWNLPFKLYGKTFIAKTATGNGGQYIMVFPELKMVAVFTGGAYNSEEDKLPFAIMKDIMLPTFAEGVSK